MLTGVILGIAVMMLMMLVVVIKIVKTIVLITTIPLMLVVVLMLTLLRREEMVWHRKDGERRKNQVRIFMVVVLGAFRTDSTVIRSRWVRAMLDQSCLICSH